jgi:hypothetical protein
MSFFYIENDGLVARFSQIQDAEKLIVPQRTLRVPDDGKKYPLPAGLGPFPMRYLEDFEANLPRPWVDRGGVIMPMYRADAMWIAFGQGYPCAIKIGAGRTNVLNGRRWTERLSRARQDYLVAPPQAALDGFCTGKDEVCQFVAVPLGRGEELMLEAEHGGIQIVIYPMKKERYDALRAAREQQGGDEEEDGGDVPDGMSQFAAGPRPVAVGLAAGGRMSERIFADEHGVDAWDQSARARCFVTLVDALQWSRITGGRPPNDPFTPADYERQGLPWFKYGDDDLKALEGAPALAAVKRPSSIAAGGGLQVLPAAGYVSPGDVTELRPVRPPRRSQHPSPVVRAYWAVRDKLLRR